jgi:hypothetical protein
MRSVSLNSPPLKLQDCTFTLPEARRPISLKYYCTILGYLVPLLHVYVTYHVWTPICNVLGYWRHRSVCYTSLFTTSLVVITVSLIHCVMNLWRCVSERSFDLFCYLFGDLLRPLFSVCLLFSVPSLGVCPFICCPSNRVFASGKEDTSPHDFISRRRGFQQFGCLGILSRWVATFISDVPCIWKVVA